MPTMQVSQAALPDDAAVAAAERPAGGDDEGNRNEDGEGGEGDNVVMVDVPIFVVEVLDHLKTLGALESPDLAVVFTHPASSEKRRELIDQKVLADVDTLAKAVDQGKRGKDLFAKSDSMVVWAELFRRWHKETPEGEKLLCWPVGSDGRDAALAIGRRRVTAKTKQEVRRVLRRLSPAKRATLRHELLFWVDLDLAAVGLKQFTLAECLAKLWFGDFSLNPTARSSGSGEHEALLGGSSGSGDPSSAPPRLIQAAVQRSWETVREEQREAAGFVGHLLELHLPPELVESRASRKKEAIKAALLDGEGSSARVRASAKAARREELQRRDLNRYKLPDLQKRAILAKVEPALLQVHEENYRLAIANPSITHDEYQTEVQEYKGAIIDAIIEKKRVQASSRGGGDYVGSTSFPAGRNWSGTLDAADRGSPEAWRGHVEKASYPHQSEVADSPSVDLGYTVDKDTLRSTPVGRRSVVAANSSGAWSKTKKVRAHQTRTLLESMGYGVDERGR